MGIFDFLKRKEQKKNVEDVLKKMSFSETIEWVGKERGKMEKVEGETFSEMMERIDELVVEIGEKIIALESFDLKSKKEDERIKNAVEESRRMYIDSLRVLVKSLEKIREVKSEKLANNINNVLSDFNKKSSKNYERANFLIGDELVNIKKSLGVFSGDILRIFGENKKDMDFLNALLIAEERINLIDSMDKTLSSIGKIKVDLNKKVDEKIMERKELSQELEKIKSDTVYLEWLAEVKEIKLFESRLDRNILELKQLVDFKGLSNFFHSDPKKIMRVREHKEHFQNNFKSDYGVSLIGLLKESEIDTGLILEKIKKIGVDMDKVKESKKNVGKDRTLDIYSRFEKIDLEIETIKMDKIREEKKWEKLKDGRKELVELLRKGLVKIGVELS